VDRTCFTVLIWLWLYLQDCDAAVLQADLAAQLRISRRTVSRCIGVLRRAGALAVTRRNGAARYCIKSLSGDAQATADQDAQALADPEQDAQVTADQDAQVTADQDAQATAHPYTKTPLKYSPAFQESSLPSSRDQPEEDVAAKQLQPCPPDFQPAPEKVRALLSEKPELRGSLDRITQKFVNRCLTQGKLCDNFDDYWLNFAKMERCDGTASDRLTVTGAGQQRRTVLADRRRADDEARARDLRERLGRIPGEGFHAGRTLAG
jgi:hypothetical protein